MAKCLFCSNDLVQSAGKKAKQFCNSTCRSNYWYGQNKKKTVSVTDLTKPNKVIKPTETPKTNTTINTLKPPEGLTGMALELWIGKQKYLTNKNK